MKDPRIAKIAKNLVNYSTNVKPGDNVLIEYRDNWPLQLVLALIDEVKAAGGRPFVNFTDMQLQRKLLKAADDEWFDTMCEIDLLRMKKMQAYISINGRNNSFELSDVPPEQMKKNTQKYLIPVHLDQRVAHTKWCILAFPNPSYAQASSMSTEAFEDFYFDVCSVDYAKMDKAMDPLKELMDKTDKVRLLGPGRTDLTFSIKGLPGIKCSGQCNIPDGEVFTAPVKDSVNGVIEYNTPTAYHGTKFDKVILTFKDGKIVKIEGSDVEKLEEIFNTDEGARYVGEFAIGVNPYVTKPMVDILFDEKICGSIHFTPGDSYEECPNGNKSGVHWDLVMIQTPEYGGGEIYFDDVLIRKDGRFVLPELEALNPENLK